VNVISILMLLASTSFAAGKVTCESYTVPAGDGCNVCHGEKCSDGECEWDNGATSCTLAGCGYLPVKKRINPCSPKLIASIHRCDEKGCDVLLPDGLKGKTTKWPVEFGKVSEVCR
jgi:hypothetical protein